MGALTVLAMAEDTPSIDSANPKPVHPFFVQGRSSMPTIPKPVNDIPTSEIEEAGVTSDATACNKVEDAGGRTVTQRGRRRKADDEPLQDEVTAKPHQKKRTRKLAGDITNHFAKLGKRDGSDKADCPGDTVNSSVSSPMAGADNHGCDLPSDYAAAQTSLPGHAVVQINGCVPDPSEKPSTTEASTVRPKKMLLFNPKTGTIGSPPRTRQAKVTTETLSDAEKRQSGRRNRKPTSKVVCIRYGVDPTNRARLGELINGILSGDTQQSIANDKQSDPTNLANESSKAPEPKVPMSSKAVHPFFTQTKKTDPVVSEDPKAKKPSSSPISARTIVYWSTPCSPKKPRAFPVSKALMPQFGVKNLGLKFPGAKLPAWPWKGMVHIRGGASGPPDLENNPLPFPCRKSKGNAVKIPPGESITSLMTKSMEVAAVAKAVREFNTDEVIPPPPELRLPQKHFESGRKLRGRILSELKTFSSSPRKGSGQGSGATMQPPPQLARLFDSICSSLSAFDMSQCETANWVHKYAPASAIEVLQPGREAFFLKEWLQALMVQSVDTGPAEPEKSKGSSKARATAGGKKKRRKKLDGFIVSSEDEDYELYEQSDEDDDWAPSGSRGIIRKTVIRSGNLGRGRDGEKTANTLIISGPHGCGKTAAVYAVAKELDFEVFEINASSRRSGKDVLERIGDMTRNHHVQQHQAGEVPTEATQHAPTEDDTAKDIKSGKQSTMNAFFKANVKRAKTKQQTKPAAKNSHSEVRKEPAKNQRQSLILLEEVDILYEEDKQFWATMVGLIAQAKRPFVMTCNDETLIPFHMFQLHGIFRLSHPPRDLSIDRLILVAANEGHVLTRQSVEQLYDSRNRDLRAATMDLQYWCQIGVGDRRGGFDWFYLRWPRGVDLDENNEVVRVVSQDTYRPGMNLLGRDSIIDTKVPPRLVEEELLHQAWESWGLDMGHWQDSIGLTSWAESLRSTPSRSAARLQDLEAYDGLAEAMSVADMCSQKSFAAFREEAIDTTQPEPTGKTQDDLVLGFAQLETPVITHYGTLATSISLTMKSLAKYSLQLHTERHQAGPALSLRPLDEGQAMHCLQNCLTSALPGSPAIGRMDFAFAFDPIAAPDTTSQPMSYLEPSVFDRTLKLITLDVAPYVRSIVAYDSCLEKQRLKLSSLVSEGGKSAQGLKRMRTTRSALSALEGRARSSTRGEKWFKADINPYLVAKTAGRGWDQVGSEDTGRPEGTSVATLEKSTGNSAKTSPKTSPNTTPTKTADRAIMRGRKRNQALLDDDDAVEQSG